MISNDLILFIEKSIINSSSTLNLRDNDLYSQLQIACINHIISFLTRVVKKAKSTANFNLTVDLNSPCLNQGINILDLCALCGFSSLASKLITNGVESQHYKKLQHAALQDHTCEANQATLSICNMIDNSVISIQSRRSGSIETEIELLPNLSRILYDNKYAGGYLTLGGACIVGAALIHNPLTWFAFASIGIPAIFAGVNSIQNQENRIAAQDNSSSRESHKQQLVELESMLSLAHELRSTLINEAKLKELKSLLLQRSKSLPKTSVEVKAPSPLVYAYENKPIEDTVDLRGTAKLNL